MDFQQFQKQRIEQSISQTQIQALKMLSMSNKDLAEEIMKFAAENPTVEIVRNPSQEKPSLKNHENSENYEQFLENQEEKGESLQKHLTDQLILLKLSSDEASLCERLIYNLDENGCYGSMLKPETLADKKRPLQTEQMVQHCIEIIQKLDPVGTCCRTLEESLFVQAKIKGDAPELALFLLDGRLEMLNPPAPEKVLAKIKEFIAEYKKKSFAKKLAIEDERLSETSVQQAINYILKLNPRPAADYYSDSRKIDFEQPDIVLKVEKVPGAIFDDDFSTGRIEGTKDFHFQVAYSSGDLPQIRICDDMIFDKENLAKAKTFIANLQFRESSIVLQGCGIVSNQREFFIKGPGHIKAFTRRQLASQLGIHESTVSRTSNKKESKYIQTEWGLFPASYFFSSGVKAENSNEKISAEEISCKIKELVEKADKPLSDLDLTEILNKQGIKISRRTVAKYRTRAGIKNSYTRKIQSDI